MDEIAKREVSSLRVTPNVSQVRVTQGKRVATIRLSSSSEESSSSHLESSDGSSSSAKKRVSAKERYRSSIYSFVALWSLFYLCIILESTGAIVLGATRIPLHQSRNSSLYGLGDKGDYKSLAYWEEGPFIYEEWTDWSWNGWKTMGDGSPMYTRGDMVWHTLSACLVGFIYQLSNAAYNKLKMQTRMVRYISLSIGGCINFILMMVVIFKLRVDVLINCGFIFCEYYGDVTYRASGWNPSYGACFAFLNLFYMLRAFKWLAWEVLYHKKVPNKVHTDDAADVATMERDIKRTNFNGYAPREPAANKISKASGAKTTCILFWIWIFVWYAATLTIPNIWEYYTPYLGIKDSNDLRSPESESWKGSWNKFAYTTYRDCDIYGPRYPDPSRERRSCDAQDRFVLKFHFDQLIQFLWMFCMMASGTANRFSKRVRHVFNTRQWIGPYQVSYQAMINGTITLLYVLLTLVYWTNIHDWKSDYEGGSTGYDQDKWPPVKIETLEDGSEVVHWNFEFWLRLSGMWALVFLSFAMYPISRNNFINDIMGVSDKVVLGIHKTSGRIFVLLMIAHIVFVGLHGMEKYHNWLDVLPILYDQKHSDHYGKLPGYKLLCYVAFIVFGIMSLKKLRNYRYQFFLVTHIGIGLPLTIATMYHANSGWYYLTPPISLYFWKAVYGDSRLRKNWIVQDMRVFTKNGCSQKVSDHIDLHRGNVVQITVIAERDEDKTTFNPGCYALLSDAAISPHRKQPFTVASAASHDSVTFVFEVTGNGRGWTHRFCKENYEYFKGRTDEQEQFKRGSISMDGPYNNNVVAHWLQRSTGVVLAAAGLGLTPGLATLLSLAHDAKKEERYFDEMKHAQMVLSVRSGSTQEHYIYDSMIPAIVDAHSGNDKEDLRIQLDIFLTGDVETSSLKTKSIQTCSGFKVKLHDGRISWKYVDLMDGIKPKDSLMHICGRPAFAKGAKEHGKKKKFSAVLKEAYSF